MYAMVNTRSSTKALSHFHWCESAFTLSGKCDGTFTLSGVKVWKLSHRVARCENGDHDSPHPPCDFDLYELNKVSSPTEVCGTVQKDIPSQTYIQTNAMAQLYFRKHTPTHNLTNQPQRMTIGWRHGMVQVIRHAGLRNGKLTETREGRIMCSLFCIPPGFWQGSGGVLGSGGRGWWVQGRGGSRAMRRRRRWVSRRQPGREWTATVFGGEMRQIFFSPVVFPRV